MYRRLRVSRLEARDLPATFTVLNLADAGPGSLRDCLGKANVAAGADTVDFDPAVTGTITLVTGELAISDAVTIQGPGSSKLTVSGNTKSRVFNLQPAPAASPIAMNGLTLTAGKAINNGSGGAVFGENEHLTLNNCVVTGNDLASFGSGGAVYSNAGLNLIATGCSFTNNVAAVGGAIKVSGAGAKTVLNACIVSGNKAGSACGLYVREYLSIINSTISGNSGTLTGSQGSALTAQGTFAPGALTIRNSTISGNSTLAETGAILVVQLNGTLVVQNSTVAGNTGGIFSQGTTGAFHLESTIVAQNGSRDIFNFGIAPVQANNCLIGIGNSQSLTITGANNQAGTTAKPLDPLLAPLANNGGPTLTRALLPGSPAIDAGSNPASLTQDQRGAGFPRSIAGPDIGAFEVLSLQVTNSNDAGPGSLRQAVGHANAHFGTDTVTFDPALFKFTGQTIKLATGEIAISEAVTITGPGPGALTISGNLASRIFNTESAPTDSLVSLSGMSLVDGRAPDSLGGGAILAKDENLLLTNCTLFGNAATISHSSGGAVAVHQRNLTAVATVFASNTATLFGGAIFVKLCTLQKCSVTGNQAVGGAGLAITGNSTLVADCTFSGNNAIASGSFGFGGAMFIGGNGSYTVRNCTISGNTAQGGGGAVYSGTDYFHVLTIENCTITANTSKTGGGAIRCASDMLLILQSTVVAQNVTLDPTAAPDVEFNVPDTVAANGSLIGVADVGNFTLSGSNNQTGTLTAPLDAKLGPLANNGGPTQTHALLPGSPAIDAGNNLASLSTDQRGLPRVFGPSADIGAYELQPVARVSSVAVNDGSPQHSRVTSLRVTFDQVPVVSGALAAAFQLKRQSDNAQVALAAGIAGNVVTLSFTGGPLDFGSLADGRYTLTMFASKVTNLDGNGDGVFGDDFVLAGTPANGLFRLFGDADGDGDVDAVDFGAFRGAFGGTTNLAFDSDGDGDVDAVDLGQFRPRFGSSI